MLQHLLCKVVWAFRRLRHDVPIKLPVLGWIHMARHFQRTSRKARLFDFDALIDGLVALARPLPDPREPLSQRPAYFGKIGIPERSKPSLNFGKVAFAGLHVDPIHMDGEGPPELSALLNHKQHPCYLQPLL